MTATNPPPPAAETKCSGHFVGRLLAGAPWSKRGQGRCLQPNRAVRRGPRGIRWLVPTLVLAFAPKCILCLLAYAGIGASLGLGGPELCGAPAGATGQWLAWLPVLGLAFGVAGGIVMKRAGR